jgi:hypothetical protein
MRSLSRASIAATVSPVHPSRKRDGARVGVDGGRRPLMGTVPDDDHDGDVDCRQDGR